MNERIRELFKRAGGKTSVRNFASNPVQVVETHELWDDHIEKFAELIVRECAGIACEHMELNEGIDYNIGSKIKQHFGVEE